MKNLPKEIYMPAIRNYTEFGNRTVEYQFGGSKTHHLNYSDHIIHQMCTPWKIGIYFQAVLSGLFTVDLLLNFPLYHSLAQRPLISYPWRMIMSHPVKFFILGLLNSLSYNILCTAEQIYSRRSNQYKTDFHLALKKDQETCEFLTFNRLLPNNKNSLSTNSRLLSYIVPHFYRFPDHTFAFIPCKDQIKELVQKIQKSPEFKEILHSTNSSDGEDRLKKIIHEYTEPLFALARLHGEL